MWRSSLRPGGEHGAGPVVEIGATKEVSETILEKPRLVGFGVEDEIRLALSRLAKTCLNLADERCVPRRHEPELRPRRKELTESPARVPVRNRNRKSEIGETQQRFAQELPFPIITRPGDGCDADPRHLFLRHLPVAPRNDLRCLAFRMQDPCPGACALVEAWPRARSLLRPRADRYSCRSSCRLRTTTT